MNLRRQVKGQRTVPAGGKGNSSRHSNCLGSAAGFVPYSPLLILPATYLTQEPYECAGRNRYGRR